MEIISNPTHDEIKKAAKALRGGHLVAFPTETVYGLGADATNEKAVARIYSVKGRPTEHPLIVHISAINQLDKWAVNIPEYAIKLAKNFWPGPLTLILPRTKLAKNFVTGGQESVGLRVPRHPVALELLKQFEAIGGYGIAAPSVNRFGAVSATSGLSAQDEVGTYLSDADLILDCAQCLVGLESTIISCLTEYPTVLRPGPITAEMIFKVSGLKLEKLNSDLKIQTSGQFKSHYAPKAQVVLNQNPSLGDGFLALANIPTPKGVIRLASPCDVEQYAHVLYSALRLGDSKNLKKIVAILPEGIGLALAIKDRLSKSSG
jgi:L-threonylcarbamoyladenylate synthase